VVQAGIEAPISAGWITGPLANLMNEQNCPIEEVPVTPEALAELLQLFSSQIVSATGAKTVLRHMWREQGDPEALLDKLNLRQQNNEQDIAWLVLRILKEHAPQVKAYRGGKKKLFGFFIGQVMQASEGKANPVLVSQILKQVLDNV
jgi:aspartyl-tRNA(Asn)/glutamyl-tRNA(Gln) amidotransferase subunit B